MSSENGDNQDSYLGIEVGFTCKARIYNANGYLNIPKTTVERLDLCKGDVVRLRIRNLSLETSKYSSKLQVVERKKGRSNEYRVNIPKDVREELDLENGQLLDIFLQKK